MQLLAPTPVKDVEIVQPALIRLWAVLCHLLMRHRRRGRLARVRVMLACRLRRRNERELPAAGVLLPLGAQLHGRAHATSTLHPAPLHPAKPAVHRPCAIRRRYAQPALALALAHLLHLLLLLLIRARPVHLWEPTALLHMRGHAPLLRLLQHHRALEIFRRVPGDPLRHARGGRRI